MANEPQSDHTPIHKSIDYERSDASFRWVLGVALISALTLIGVFVFVAVFYDRDEQDLATARQSPFPLVKHPSTQLPPEPLLEPLESLKTHPLPTVYETQLSREEMLRSYGTTDDDNYVHIPIDRAIETLADKLPAREQPPKIGLKDNGLLDAGESNSGRIFRREPR